MTITTSTPKASFSQPDIPVTQVRQNQAAELDAIAKYRRAANYLAATQIYLKDNVLLRDPLKPEHIKDRLLGHWGTCPGINLVYAHLNRLINWTRTWCACEPCQSLPRRIVTGLLS